jgi:signal transduction histidine kinase
MMESLAGLLSSTGLILEPLLTTKSRESGLGLSLAKRLAETNDGRIRVVSAPGGRSRFTMELSSGCRG